MKYVLMVRLYGQLSILRILILLLSLSGCADQVSFEAAKSIDPVGFLHGIWHGFIALLSFVCSLFSDDIAVYAIYNNGGWYDWGN